MQNKQAKSEAQKRTRAEKVSIKSMKIPLH